MVNDCTTLNYYPNKNQMNKSTFSNGTKLCLIFGHEMVERLK